MAEESNQEKQSVSRPKTVEELEEEVARLDATCTALNKLCISGEERFKHMKQICWIVGVAALVFGGSACVAIPVAVRRGFEIQKIFRGLVNWTPDQKSQLVDMGLNPNQLQKLNNKYVSK